MTTTVSEPLPVLAPSESCECLGGTLWQTILTAAAFAFFGVSLAWLLQAAQTAAPGAVWWKSLVSLGCVLAFTYFLRMARRLDSHARQGWTIFDAALLLAGGFVTAIFVMRGGALLGAAFITFFVALEGHTFWRLKLLPAKAIAFWKPRAPNSGSPRTSAATPLSTMPAEELGATELASSDEANAEISQQLTRRSTENGEAISGFVRGRFEPGEILTSVDVAFCPTLNREPTLDFETICEEELEVHVATLKPFGARLDLKRKGDAQSELAFTLELHIECKSSAETDEAIREPADS